MIAAAVPTLSLDNAVVWSGEDATPVRGSLVLAGGTVAQAARAPDGDASVVTAQAGGAHGDESRRRVDLGGAHIVPGFIDAHTHLSVAAWVPWFADGSSWTSGEQALAEIRKAASLRTIGWIMAFNIDDDEWTGRCPSAVDLEEAAPGRAVLLVHLSLHRALLSETALRRLEISRSTHDPAGDIERGRNGRPTGLVWEGIFGRALTTALLETARGLTPERLDDLLCAEAERHLALGITACHDPCIPEALLPAMMRLAERTPLRLSWSHVSPHGVLDPPDAATATRPCGDGPASAKLFLDGAHRCALCFSPLQAMAMAGTAVGHLLRHGNTRPMRELMRTRTVYRHPHVHTPYLRCDDAELSNRLRGYAERGVRPKIHALGNEAVAQACRALRSHGMRDSSIEHLLLLSDREIEDVAASGAIASVQPGFIPHYGASLLDRGMAGRLRVVPAASLLESGIRVALSSDHPCGPLDPLFNIRQAIRRHTSDGRVLDAAEAMTPSAALSAYTLGGFRAIHGTAGGGLIVGRPADFAVLSGPPENNATRVLRTWVDGREVWRASDQDAIHATA